MTASTNEGPTAGEPDPDETDRYQIQTIIRFLEIRPKHDLTPGVLEALSWAQSAACDAARRIFAGMAREGDDA